MTAPESHRAAGFNDIFNEEKTMPKGRFIVMFDMDVEPLGKGDAAHIEAVREAEDSFTDPAILIEQLANGCNYTVLSTPIYD
ncbi:hypothetical protein SB778_03985 [Paraburkholderia sp. SIMBA_050]